MAGAMVELDELKMWKAFHAAGNEMVISNKGR